MQMRMPDRLQFALQVDAGTRQLPCPPMTLLTLVENAVRHGIDPSEEGGRIDIHAEQREGRCHISVIDTGVGLRTSGGGLGTGLATLRERLQLAFGGAALMTVREVAPHGVRVHLDYPVPATPGPTRDEAD
jgi:sensor histidine kinase YesM